MRKEGISSEGFSKLSGSKSASSINLYAKICVTSLAGIGGRPGPRMKALLKPLLTPDNTMGGATGSSEIVVSWVRST